jgi:ParB family chromosome partitioning protein
MANAEKPNAQCLSCAYKKGMMNKAKGKKIPGVGKCTHPEGFIPPKRNCLRYKKEKGDVPTTPPETTPLALANGSQEVKLSLIYPNPAQPRKFFPREALEELALSIQEQGLIEPLVVVPRGERFMLVAGERRWRACQMVGLETVPVRVIEADDRQVAEMALVENLQRQDLTPLEEARAFKEMLDKGYTREELARKLGFKQAWRIDERLSLLNLASKFQEALAQGFISSSQACWMSKLADHNYQEIVFRKIKAGEFPTHNHLRRFVNALVDASKQTALFEQPKKDHLEVANRWERVLNAVTRLICKSFSPEDCRVLARVCQGDIQLNLTRLDLIMKHLSEIKKAMLEAASRQEAARLAQNTLNDGPLHDTEEVTWVDREEVNERLKEFLG